MAGLGAALASLVEMLQVSRILIGQSGGTRYRISACKSSLRHSCMTTAVEAWFKGRTEVYGPWKSSLRPLSYGNCLRSKFSRNILEHTGHVGLSAPLLYNNGRQVMFSRNILEHTGHVGRSAPLSYNGRQVMFSRNALQLICVSQVCIFIVIQRPSSHVFEEHSTACRPCNFSLRL